MHLYLSEPDMEIKSGEVTFLELYFDTSMLLEPGFSMIHCRHMYSS